MSNSGNDSVVQKTLWGVIPAAILVSASLLYTNQKIRNLENQKINCIDHDLRKIVTEIGANCRSMYIDLQYSKSRIQKLEEEIVQLQQDLKKSKKHRRKYSSDSSSSYEENLCKGDERFIQNSKKEESENTLINKEKENISQIENVSSSSFFDSVRGPEDLED